MQTKKKKEETTVVYNVSSYPTRHPYLGGPEAARTLFHEQPSPPEPGSGGWSDGLGECRLCWLLVGSSLLVNFFQENQICGTLHTQLSK